MHRSTQPSIKTNNSDSEHVLRVCLTKNKASIATKIPNQNSNNINCLKINGTYASQVYLSQNYLARAQRFHNLKSNNP